MNGLQLLPLDNPVPPIWGEAAESSLLDIIVFSKDRACQLDALLRSTRAFFHYPHRVHIVYTTSSLAFERGYDLLRLWHPGPAWIGDEGGFTAVVKSLIARISRGPGRYLMFLVDDLMFTRSITAQPLMESLDWDGDILAISLRLGENITYAYSIDQPTTPPDFIRSKNNTALRWAWNNACRGDWDYPMSLDAHIFRTADIAALIPRLEFVSPNTLESALSGQPFARPDMVCEQFPSVINVAANRVQSNYQNRCGNISAEFLNESLLGKLAIDAEHFTGRLFDSCHIEEDLPLIDDHRSRLPPPATFVEGDGGRYQRIDLRQIQTFVINCPDNIGRRIFMEEQLRDLGMRGEFIRGLRVQPGWVGVALSHLKVLRLTRARAPFLLLEDDCVFTPDFRPILEIPVEAEALYLGTSTYGLGQPGEIGWGGHGCVQWQRFGGGYVRVFNMFASHALLYLDDSFCNLVIDAQVEALSSRNFPRPFDIDLAALHASHVVLATARNMARQLARSETSVSLPEALPDQEVGGQASTALPVSSGPELDEIPAALCLVSHRYQFICVLIAKNASSSLLGEFSKPRYESELVSLNELDETIANHYFKFAFLRDPVSRAASAYQEISLRHELGDLDVAAKGFMDMEDGAARWVAFLGEIGDGSWDTRIQPQAKIIGAIEIDFFGQVEALQSDLEKLFDLLQIDDCPVLAYRRSRETRKLDYGYDRFYIDHLTLPPAQINLIREIFRYDVALIQRQCPGAVVELQLRGGARFDVPLDADSNHLHALRQMTAKLSEPEESRIARLVQLPLDGGRQALTFSSSDVDFIRLIPQPAPAVQEVHPAMNADEGHLGGYIRSGVTMHGEVAVAYENGDPLTFEPELWQWAYDELGVRSVLDVGCGEGNSAAFFRDLGCRVLGVDGSEQAERDSKIPGMFRRHDYVHGPFVPQESFDLVWSCEFVEHVEARYSHNFLATFAAAQQYIFMTHALPGQQGWHHVNCQDEAYWIAKVEPLGFRLDRGLTETARAVAGTGYFSTTGLVFVRLQGLPGVVRLSRRTGVR